MSTHDPMDSEWWQAQSDLYYGDDLPYELSFAGLLTLGLIQLECARRMASSGPVSSWCERMAWHLFRLESFNHHLLRLHHQCIADHFRWRVAKDPFTATLPDEPAGRRLEMIRRWRGYLLEEVPDLMRDPDIARAFAIVLVYRNFSDSDRVADQLDRLLLARYGEETVSHSFVEWVARRAT